MRYKYEVCGKISGQYDYFSLHDYIYTKPDNLNITLNNIQNELINIDDIFDTENPEDFKESMKIALDNNAERLREE